MVFTCWCFNAVWTRHPTLLHTGPESTLPATAFVRNYIWLYRPGNWGSRKYTPGLIELMSLNQDSNPELQTIKRLKHSLWCIHLPNTEHLVCISSILDMGSQSCRSKQASILLLISRGCQNKHRVRAENRNVFSDISGIWIWDPGAGSTVPSRGSSGKSIHCFFQLLGSVALWPHGSSLCLFVHMSSSSTACV